MRRCAFHVYKRPHLPNDDSDKTLKGHLSSCATSHDSGSIDVYREQSTLEHNVCVSKEGRRRRSHSETDAPTVATRIICMATVNGVNDTQLLKRHTHKSAIVVWERREQKRHNHF